MCQEIDKKLNDFVISKIEDTKINNTLYKRVLSKKDNK